MSKLYVQIHEVNLQPEDDFFIYIIPTNQNVFDDVIDVAKYTH